MGGIAGGDNEIKQLANSGGITIDPSTEEKQDDIIDELQSAENKQNVSQDLLEKILLELKIINIHLQSMTDEDVSDADVTKR